MARLETCPVGDVVLPDTPVAIMKQVFERAREPKQFWVVPEAGHGGVFQARPSECESHVVPFLDASIRRALDAGEM